MPITHEKWGWTNDRLVKEAFGYLRRINPAIRETDLLDSAVGRLKYAQPVCGPRFLETLPNVQTPIAGLQAADTCYYYPEDRGISESIRFGRMMADCDRYMSYAQPPRPSSEFIRFVVTGGIAAGVNVGVRIPFGWVMPYSISIIAAYLIGMTTAFVLARALVFRPTSRSVAGEYMRFTLVNAVALAQVLLVSLCLERLIFPRLGLTWHSQTVAHAIGVASPVVASYYGHKFFSFRGATPDRDPDFS